MAETEEQNNELKVKLKNKPFFIEYVVWSARRSLEKNIRVPVSPFFNPLIPPSSRRPDIYIHCSCSSSSGKSRHSAHQTQPHCQCSSESPHINKYSIMFVCLHIFQYSYVAPNEPATSFHHYPFICHLHKFKIHTHL